MSGHSKWSQIKHKKAQVDQNRGKIFSRLSRLITIAAKSGIDPKTNLALNQAIERAKKENMPNYNIERAIGRANEKNSADLEELFTGVVLQYNTILRVHIITDNKNRSLADIRKLVSTISGKVVPIENISWLLSQKSTAPEEYLNEIRSLIDTLNNLEEVQEVSSNL